MAGDSYPHPAVTRRCFTSRCQRRQTEEFEFLLPSGRNEVVPLFPPLEWWEKVPKTEDLNKIQRLLTLKKMVLEKSDIHRPKNEAHLISYLIKLTQEMDHIFKCKVIKLLEDNIGGNLWDLGLGQKFSDMTPIA